MNEQELQQLQQQEQQQPLPAVYGSAQNAEFLRYLLDTQEPITELMYELEGKEITIQNEQPVLTQTRPPLVNPALRNSIIGFFKTYNTKGFITTNLTTTEINRIVQEVSNSTIDMLERSNTFSSVDWRENPVYQKSYPSFIDGHQQQILLMVEHTVLASLKRSQNAITLNKVTGMHQSIESKTDAQQKKGGLLSVFRR